MLLQGLRPEFARQRPRSRPEYCTNTTRFMRIALYTPRAFRIVAALRIARVVEW